MTMMHQRRETSLVIEQELTPRKEKDVSVAYFQSRGLKVHMSRRSMLEVVNEDKTFVVDLSSWSCSCQSWKICKNSCTCIESKSLSVYEFCDKYVKIPAYCESYKDH